jgi:ribosome biogenesis ATPase
MAIIEPIKRPGAFARVGITAPSGVLLWGPPGCGKTLLAKAVANESRANFISIKGPELLNKYVGESERAVRQVFERARSSVPCILFFDELDALVPKREDALSEASSKVVNTLLTELDGVNGRQGIYVVGATNRPDMIDPAMLRPGRLGQSVFIDLPTEDERVEILRALYTKALPKAPTDDLEAVARDPRANGFSGADLGSLHQAAAVAAIKRARELKLEEDDVTITMADWEVALGKVKPSVKDVNKYRRLKERGM